MKRARMIAMLALGTVALLAQKPAPIQSQSASVYRSTVDENGETTVDILNVDFDLSWAGVPGRPPNEHLVLRKTTRTRQTLGEKGMEAKMNVDVWPAGKDLKEKPLYSIALEAIECRMVNADLLEFARGLEEVEWWSLYKLGTGEHFFDTYVPLVKFSISRDTVRQRYVGLEVPPDDTSDARLKDPHVVSVLTYASPEKVIREAMITADDPKRAQLLRSYADASRTVTYVYSEGGASRSLRIAISQNYPSAARTATIVVPIVKDDLDLAHAQVPVGLHVKAWVR